MNRIVLWKGYHSPEIGPLIRRTWVDNDLLILFPPQLETLDCLKWLPNVPVELAGDWSTRPDLSVARQEITYPQPPVLGLFSTGTTGRKLVLYSKHNIESSLKGILSFFDEDRIRTIFCYPQPFHVFGLVLGYLHAMLHDRKLVAPEGNYSRQAHALRNACDDKHTLTLGTPTHFRDWIEFSRATGRKPPPSYACVVGAAQVPRSLWLAMRDELSIEQPSIGYGATEASPGVTHLRPGLEPKEDGEVGEPLPHLRVQVREEGLSVVGDSVCLATISSAGPDFSRELMLKDRLERRSDGILVYKGRVELVLNRGGEKFSLEEFETFLRQRLGREVVCFAVPDDRLGEELGVCIEGEPNVSDETLVEILKAKYVRAFSKENFRWLPKLPLNASSKHDRHAAARIFAERAT